MLAFLFAVAALLTQGPVLPNQGGTITGVVRDVNGAPAVGVRIAAMPRADSLRQFSAGSFVSLAETDSAGRYRLESVPAGQYYVAAGRTDAPTYFPGKALLRDARAISIVPGATVSGIDFVMGRANVGRVCDYCWVVPLDIQVEGGKVPLFGGGTFPFLRARPVPGSGIDVPLAAPDVTLSGLRAMASSASGTVEYRVTVEELPAGYQVKSLTFGRTDLTRDPLELSFGPLGAFAAPQSIRLVLSPPVAASGRGVRIVGRLSTKTRRAIYISGNSGSIYTDGTYEFTGVPAGLHRIVALDPTGAERPLGAEVVVGDREVNDVELQELALLPEGSDRPAAPLPSGNRAPGTNLPLLSIRGRVVDKDTGQPFSGGRVVVNGDDSHSFPLNDEGRFEISRIVRGRYSLEVSVFGVGSVSRTVVVEDEDAILEFTVSSEPAR